MSWRRRRQRASAPALPLARGLSFSDSTDPGRDAGEDWFSSTGTVPRDSFDRLRLLASASVRRGMGGTFPPMSAAEELSFVRRRSPLVGGVSQLSPPRRGLAAQSAFALARGGVAGRLLQTPPFSRSLARLDRRSRVCVSRLVRKQVLFAAGVAGVNRRLSPGVRGRYRRGVDSSFACR